MYEFTEQDLKLNFISKFIYDKIFYYVLIERMNRECIDFIENKYVYGFNYFHIEGLDFHWNPKYKIMQNLKIRDFIFKHFYLSDKEKLSYQNKEMNIYSYKYDYNMPNFFWAYLDDEFEYLQNNYRILFYGDCLPLINKYEAKELFMQDFMDCTSSDKLYTGNWNEFTKYWNHEAEKDKYERRAEHEWLCRVSRRLLPQLKWYHFYRGLVYGIISWFFVNIR